MGENGKSGHLSIFTSLKHLMMLLKCKIARAQRRVIHVHVLCAQVMTYVG